ncbi:MAG TPA: hypothetical protein VGH76_01295 [Actinomycetospora sp.]|jgi:hypothetical protein
MSSPIDIPRSPASPPAEPAAPEEGDAAELATFLAAENVANDYHPGLEA